MQYVGQFDSLAQAPSIPPTLLNCGTAWLSWSRGSKSSVKSGVTAAQNEAPLCCQPRTRCPSWHCPVNAMYGLPKTSK